MVFYTLAALILIGISHIYLYIICIRYRRMSLPLLAVLSIVFTALLGIAVTLTGYPELNIVMLTLFLLAIGYLQKRLMFLHSLYFALFSTVTYTVLKTVLYQLTLLAFMVSPFNLYVWTESMLHFAVTVVLLAGIILSRKKIGQFSTYIVQSRFYVPTFLLLIVSILLIFIINYPSTGVLSYMHMKYGQASYIAVLVLFLLLVLIFVLSYHLSKEHLVEEHEKRLYEQLMDYVGKLEEMHDELATFRHDYVNILLSLDDGIRTKNFAQIERVYREIIQPTSLVINNQELEITKLSRIAVPEIKSIVSVKVLSAQQKKLHVAVDIPEEINDLFLPTDQLIRILSILLDNAIEEAVQTAEKFLQLSIFKMNDCQYFIVRNSSARNTINLQEIYKKKKSDKSGDRGYGLFSLKRMIDQNANVTLETAFEPPVFTQIIMAKKVPLMPKK